MNDRARPVHRVISSLGHISRFQLALLLLECPACVSDLARRVGLSQSCTTRHLQALQRAGIVQGTREGKRVVFRTVTDRDEVNGLLALLALEEAAPAPAPAPGGTRGRTAGTRRGPARRAKANAVPARRSATSVPPAAAPRTPGPDGNGPRARPEPFAERRAEPVAELARDRRDEDDEPVLGPARRSQDLEDFLL